MIWQRPFVDEDEPKPKPYKRRDKLGWVERIVAEYGLDNIWDLITYTTDNILFDEDGTSLKALSLYETAGLLASGDYI